MPPAARLKDNHICPLPMHVGGPIIAPCCPTVKTEGRPAARVGDMAECKGAVDVISKGSMTVKIGGQFAARMGDPTVHGGKIVEGASTVMIGDMSYQDCSCLAQAAQAGSATISDGGGE